MSFFSANLNLLEAKINKLNYPLSAVIWPSLSVCLTDIVNKKNSLEILDYLVSHPYSPEMFLCIAVSIFKHIEKDICK